MDRTAHRRAGRGGVLARSFPGRARPRPGGFAALAGSIALFAASAAGQDNCVPHWTAYAEFGGVVQDFDVFDEDGPGPLPVAMYTSGNMVWLGSQVGFRIMRTDGWRLTWLGEGVSGTTFDTEAVLGVGPPTARSGVPGGIYLGGDFESASGVPALNIANFRDGAWSALGPGRPEDVLELAVANRTPKVSNPPLIVGSRRDEHIGTWDGQNWARWPEMFVKPSAIHFPSVRAIGEFDPDGPGPAPLRLYAGGGSFITATGLQGWSVALWDGEHWQSLGWGSFEPVYDFEVFDADGDGPEPSYLYVAGPIEVGPINGVWTDCHGLARWDGYEWSLVPGWTGGGCAALEVFDDDGPGPRPPSLFIGGAFNDAAGTGMPGIIRWDGQSYWPLDGGIAGIASEIYALQAFDEDGDGPNPGGLYVGGIYEFVNIGSQYVYSPGFARWGCPLPSRCEGDCDQSTGAGVLDFFDFLCFQDRFAIEDPWACDCDTSTGPSVCDFFDFLCFQDDFAEGCP